MYFYQQIIIIVFIVGRSLLADARSDLRWRKVYPNGTEGDLLPTQTEIKTTRWVLMFNILIFTL